MEKLRMKGLDAVEGNVAKIAALFPQCVTERLNKEGRPELAIDFDKLRAELSSDAIDTGEERYQFTWPDKRAASRLANTPTDKTLRPDVDDSVDFWNTENLYIEGDNLDVLKVLRENYLGKVKMIYIDPPYNTGKDFVYHDYFAQGKEDFEATNGLFDEDGNQVLDPMQRNTESNGRFHTNWLNMMYPRLKIARNLLAKDGVIFISIGVEELDNLKKICNEVFGEQNFIEVFSWVKTSTPPSLATKSRKTNEYILCYENNKSAIKYDGVALDGGDAPLLNSGNPIIILKFGKDKVYFKPDKFPNGLYKAHCKNRVELLDDIEIVDGYATTDFRLKGEFKWTQDFLEAEVAEGTTFIIKSDEFSIRFIRAGEGYKRPTNFIKDSIISPLIDKPGCGVGTNENASSHLNSLMDNSDVFSYPKPVTLIQYLTNFIIEDGDIILDFFSGSGTTAESIMRYCLENSDKSNLKYILVQLQENLDETIKTADSVTKKIIENGIKFLDKYNKPHLLTELAKERIRRAGRKIKEEACRKGQDLDTGFRVLKLDSSNMEDVFYTPDEFDEAKLVGLIDNVKPDRTPLDLLFQVMPELNIELSARIEEREVDGKRVFFVDGTYLIATFDADVNEMTVTEIARMQPQYFVMRDASAANDNVIDNFDQIFRNYSPDTVCRIL